MNRNIALVASLIALLCIGQATWAGSETFTSAPFSDYLDVVDQELTVPQFDTMGGTRVLTSVEIFADAWLSDTIAGTIKNNSTNQVTTFTSSFKDATISLSGPGFSTPVNASASTLYTYGPVTIGFGETYTITPETHTLPATGHAILTTDLSPFIGSSSVTYLLNASGYPDPNLSVSANVLNGAYDESFGGGSIQIIYNFESAAVPLPTSSVAGASMLGLLILGGYLRRARKSGVNA